MILLDTSDVKSFT